MPSRDNKARRFGHAGGKPRDTAQVTILGRHKAQEPALSGREETLRLIGEGLVVVGLLVLLVCLCFWQSSNPGLAFDRNIEIPATLLGRDVRLDAIVSQGPLINGLTFPKGYVLFDLVVSFAAISALVRRRMVMMLAMLALTFLPVGLIGINALIIKTGGWVILIGLIVQSWRSGKREQAAGWGCVLVFLWWITGQPFIQTSDGSARYGRVDFGRLEAAESPKSPAQKGLSEGKEALLTPTEQPFSSFLMLKQPLDPDLAYVLSQEAYLRGNEALLRHYLPMVRDHTTQLSTIGKARLEAMEYALGNEGTDRSQQGITIAHRVAVKEIGAWITGALASLLLVCGYGLQFLAGKIVARIERMTRLMAASPPDAASAIAAAAPDTPRNSDLGTAATLRLLTERARRAGVAAAFLLAVALAMLAPSVFLSPPEPGAWPAFTSVHLMPALLPLIPEGTTMIYDYDVMLNWQESMVLVLWVGTAVSGFILLLQRRYGQTVQLLLCAGLLHVVFALLPPPHGMHEIALSHVPASLRSDLRHVPADAELDWATPFAEQAYPYVAAQIAYLEGNAEETYAQLSRLQPLRWQGNALALWRITLMSEWTAANRSVTAVEEPNLPSFSLRRTVFGILSVLASATLGLAAAVGAVWILLKRRAHRMQSLLNDVFRNELWTRSQRLGETGLLPAIIPEKFS